MVLDCVFFQVSLKVKAVVFVWIECVNFFDVVGQSNKRGDDAIYLCLAIKYVAHSFIKFEFFSFFSSILIFVPKRITVSVFNSFLLHVKFDSGLLYFRFCYWVYSDPYFRSNWDFTISIPHLVLILNSLELLGHLALFSDPRSHSYKRNMKFSLCQFFLPINFRPNNANFDVFLFFSRLTTTYNSSEIFFLHTDWFFMMIFTIPRKSHEIFQIHWMYVQFFPQCEVCRGPLPFILLS